MNPVRDNKSWHTYILLNKKDGKWYTGSTDDLRKRFKIHNDDRTTSTKNRGQFQIMYYEMCLGERDARSRELYLKSGMGKRYVKSRLKRFLSLTG
ncbi:GIY-YIG nuclease family protein [Patescibacteria group bacterium]|nr:GIY-YIG nuclease family protein [Patescibacteria group bacterium]